MMDFATAPEGVLDSIPDIGVFEVASCWICLKVTSPEKILEVNNRGHVWG